MGMMFPQSQIGAAGEVTVNGYPMRLLTDDDGAIVQYEENDPERFADKISIGDLRYGDFNPYENAHIVGHFDGGYGVDRLTDLNDETLGIGTVKESLGVDCRFGPAFLAPLLVQETLPSSAATPVWVGEFTPSTGAVTGAHLVAVGGLKVWYRQSNGTWVDTGLTLSAAAVQGTVVVVGGQLIIGYGAAATAQFITALDGTSLANVTNTTPTNLYIFAATVDRAAVYIAGGTAATNSNQVLSSAVTAASPAVAFGLAASAVVCGGTDRPITALAPGGAVAIGSNGQALVFVASQKELGVIAEITVAGGATPVAVYLIVMPFDSTLATNGQGLKWWQGTGSEQQRGPAVLVFNRDRSPWTYAPAQAVAQNIAAWANPGYTPPTVQGKATCFQGTARWLYYAITTGAGHSYLLARDSHAQYSGSLTQGALTSTVTTPTPTHSLLDLGVNACQAMVVTSLFGTNPLLFFGRGNNIAQITLPLDGENPLRDSACPFGSSGTLTLPDIDHNFPDEDKVEFSIRLVHDNVSPGAQGIAVAVALDGGAFTTLGSAATGNGSSVSFATSTVSKRITLQLTFSTTDPTKTPILRAVAVRASVNPLLYKEWIMQCLPVAGSLPSGTQDLQNVYAMMQGFWSARANGIPFSFTDVWQDSYSVRLLRFRVKHIRHPVKRPPEVAFYFDLLRVSDGPGNVTYGGALATYGAVTSKYA